MYRSTIEEYSGAIKKLAEMLLSILSEYLDLHPTRLQEAIGELYQNINFGYYPPCPQSENVQGMGSHSDYGALTILWQNEVNGLQVRKSDKWIMVKPTVPGALIVNAGDTLEVISTDDKPEFAQGNQLIVGWSFFSSNSFVCMSCIFIKWCLFIVYDDQIFSEVTTETLGTQYDFHDIKFNLGQFLDNVEC